MTTLEYLVETRCHGFVRLLYSKFPFVCGNHYLPNDLMDECNSVITRVAVWFWLVWPGPGAILIFLTKTCPNWQFVLSLLCYVLVDWRLVFFIFFFAYLCMLRGKIQ